jgi:hypothetical protein
MNNQKLLALIDKTWTALLSSYEGLTPEQMEQPGASGEWSVKDILAHVTTWEAESLEHLPRMARGEKNASYRNLYGGIDAFNALMTERKKDLPLDEVLRQLAETHGRLVEYVGTAPDEQFASKNRCRARLGWDSHKHYPVHEQAIRAWRAARGI